MHVEHFMTLTPVACDVDAPIAQVAALMRDKNVGCVVALEGGKVAGLVTDRQIVVTAVASGNLGQAKVRDIMTRKPVVVTSTATMFQVVQKFRENPGVRRLPVLNGSDELVGIVSLSDLAVMARDLLDPVMHESLVCTLEEVHVETGGKRIAGHMGKKAGAPESKPNVRPVTRPTA